MEEVAKRVCPAYSGTCSLERVSRASERCVAPRTSLDRSVRLPLHTRLRTPRSPMVFPASPSSAYVTTPPRRGWIPLFTSSRYFAVPKHGSSNDGRYGPPRNQSSAKRPPGVTALVSRASGKKRKAVHQLTDDSRYRPRKQPDSRECGSAGVRECKPLRVTTLPPLCAPRIMVTRTIFSSTSSARLSPFHARFSMISPRDRDTSWNIELIILMKRSMPEGT
jgi:hypothetical protein